MGQNSRRSIRPPSCPIDNSLPDHASGYGCLGVDAAGVGLLSRLAQPDLGVPVLEVGGPVDGADLDARVRPAAVALVPLRAHVPRLETPTGADPQLGGGLH